MTEIGKIIQSVLEESELRVPAERLALKCEQKLLAATMVQVAALLGGNVKRDDEGHAVICTDIQMEEDRLSLCDIPLHFFE